MSPASTPPSRGRAVSENWRHEHSIASDEMCAKCRRRDAHIAELEALLRDDPELRLCRQYIALLEPVVAAAREYRAIQIGNPRRAIEETAELVGGLAKLYAALDAAITPESLSSHE